MISVLPKTDTDQRADGSAATFADARSLLECIDEDDSTQLAERLQGFEGNDPFVRWYSLLRTALGRFDELALTS